LKIADDLLSPTQAGQI